MTENAEPSTKNPNESVAGEKSETIQRVSLVSSSPSIRSIIRVVVIVLILLAVKDFFGTVISSLTFLFFVIVLAVFFAYIINPLVNLIQKPFSSGSVKDRTMPRSLAIALSYLLVFTVLGVSIAYIAPRITQQAKTFADNVPTYTTFVQSTLDDFNRRLDRMRISENFQKEINNRINGFLNRVSSYITENVGEFAIIAVKYIPWFILIPILAFFFLKDANLFRLGLLRVVPVGEWRTRVESFMSDVNNTLAAYARAQIISCILIGTICTVGFYLTGNNYALLLGILAGIFEFVPLIGPLAVAIIATSVAGFESGWQAVWTAVFLTILRIVHDYVTYPRIVRDGIHLHPLAIILSVLAGEQVAGIPGVFIAIPLVALVTVLYKHILEHSGSRRLFTGLLEPAENKEISK